MKSWCGLLALLVSTHYVAGDNDGSQQTPLDDFVFGDESMSQFSYFHASDYDFNGVNIYTQVSYNVYVLNVTSGEWQTEDTVDRSTWWHIMFVIIPDNLNPAYASNGTIYITGNRNTDNDGSGVPSQDDNDLILAATIATGVGMPAAVFFHVPNAPIVFASDPDQRDRVEDEIVAYSWSEFLLDLDNIELNAYVAMVRAGVRSMDAFSQFSSEELGTAVTHFTISGASKRGWTTWLTAAMEQGPLGSGRVAAIAPFVWDGINLDDVFHNQYRSYGGWAVAIEDYVENGIMPYLDTPEMEVLQDLIDPFHYRTRLTMPKLVITGLMDEFQMVDDEKYWWDELPSGPDGSSAPSDGNTKWLIKNPNTAHGQDTAYGVDLPVWGTWLTHLLNGWDIPYLTWDYDSNSGDVTVYTHGGEVFSAQMWSAASCNDGKRDHRITNLDSPCECGPVVEEQYCVALGSLWYKDVLEPNDDGSYTGHIEPPADGRWGAFVVNVQMLTEHTNNLNDPMHNFFTRGGMRRGTPRWPFTPPGYLEFSSRGSVVPDTFPFEDCTQESCEGPLV